MSKNSLLLPDIKIKIDNVNDFLLCIHINHLYLYFLAQF